MKAFIISLSGGKPFTFDVISLLMIILIILLMAGMIALTGYVFKSISNFKGIMDDFVTKQKNDIEESINKSNDIILNTIKSIMSNMIPNAVSSAIEHPEPTLYSMFSDIKNSIKDNAVMCMDKVQANRLAIYLFHNGNVSTHGVKFFKMTCVGESIVRGSGLRERMLEHASININILDDTITDIVNIGHYVVLADKDIEDNTKHKLFISNPKIKYSLIVPIYDHDNNALGLVCVECPLEYVKDKGDRQIETIKDFIDQIVPILSYSKYTDIASKPSNNPLQ